MREKILVLSLAFILPLSLLAQDDISEIFDDLADFEPAAAPPVTPAPETAAPTTTTPSPEPAPANQPTTIQMPPQQSPVFYTPESTAERAAAMNEPEPLPIDVEDYIARGKAAYKDNDWTQSQKFFEAVLYTDPYNTTAIRWLKSIANRKAGREEKSYDTTRARMLENVQAAWNTPKAEGEPADITTAEREPTPDELRKTALRKKLEAIQIPAVTFQNADIQQVVLELSALCRKLDGEGKGVNLVVFGTSETLLPPITFSGTDLSALETLDIITQMSGMKYEIGANMVSLTPVNYEPPQQMVSTEFDVMPSVGAKMALMSGGETGASGLIDVRGFFDILLVHNAAKHLPAIESQLNHYNKKAREARSRQVEIETKFIEVAEGALDELGFEWTVGEPGTYLNNDTVAIAGGQKLFTDTLRTGEEAFGSDVSAAGRAASFNSYAGAAAASIADSMTGAAGELLVQKIKGDIKIDLLIRALERQEGSDLLSAPKVLAKSGETASIHVGEIRSFPTAYDVVIERYAQPSLVPLDYEQYKTGVMLEVTPELDTENHTIDLKLAPEIKELAGFDEQHAATIWPDFGDEQIDLGGSVPVGLDALDFLTAREENRTINADRLIARMPVFKSRKVETAVTIEDGSTIAMGGLIKEKKETFKDSVPILGKIPLLGRLFRSEGERMVKRNLLIFVTANQVDTTGYKKAAE
jgi:general secretion pathway protein D